MPSFQLPIHLPVHPQARVDGPRRLIAVDVFTASHELPAQYIVMLSRHDAAMLHASLGAAIKAFDTLPVEAKVIKLPRKRKKG